MVFKCVGELIRGQKPITLAPRASVQGAAERMAEHRIGAILVVESSKLKGIFTERDLLNRVVAKRLRPQEVCLEEVMTRDPITVESDATLVQSLATMLEQNFRHLPVLDNGYLVGMLSCRDIPASYWIKWENWVAAQNQLKSAAG